MPQAVPMMKATRRPKRREIAPVGSVPAASPTTYIDSGTVANEISGAKGAPTIQPVAKVKAGLATVSGCAGARRTTLDRARASSLTSSLPDTFIAFPARISLSGLIDSWHYREAQG